MRSWRNLVEAATASARSPKPKPRKPEASKAPREDFGHMQLTKHPAVRLEGGKLRHVTCGKELQSRGGGVLACGCGHLFDHSEIYPIPERTA